MKKTLFISTAVLLSLATTAQTKITSDQASKSQTSIHANSSSIQSQGEVSASSSAAVSHDGLANASRRTKAEVRKDKNRIKAKKEQTAKQVKQNSKAVIAETDRDAAVSASAKSNTVVNTGAADNHLNTESSSSAGTTASTAQVKKQVSVMATDGTDAVRTKTATSIASGNEAISNTKSTGISSAEKIKATSATTPRAVIPTVHPAQPVIIKTNSVLKTNAGIRL